MSLLNKLSALRAFHGSGATKPIAFRKKQLLLLKEMLAQNEEKIYEAVHKDLHKSIEECWVTENGFVMAEISMALKNIERWIKPQKVKTNLLNFPASSFIMSEPLGVVLIISPWNYPLQLLLTPLVGAIAAGNCVVLKSSEFAPATSALMKKMFAATFPENYILFTEGEGSVIVPEMMNNFTFDHVFYTGSTNVGKIIYKLAAPNLTPVTLELGGKSPCIVEADANIKVTAKRIAMTKFSNTGQMCVAPDYVLVHRSVKSALEAALKQSIFDFFGDDPQQSESYGRIINEKQFERLVALLHDGQLIHGGKNDRPDLYIEPTLLSDIKMNTALMEDEIFGPILPIIAFDSMNDALTIIAKNKNPLAFYIFTSSVSTEKKWLEAVPFGGGCVNNASWHLTNHHLPFGGRGYSGTGHYHGKFSFDCFSHKKGILKTATWFDPAVKYPPFKGKLKLFKWIIR